jgi:hypothetical protein
MKTIGIILYVLSLFFFISCGGSKDDANGGGNNSNPINLTTDNPCVNEMIAAANNWTPSAYSGTKTAFVFQYYENQNPFIRDSSQTYIDNARNEITTAANDYGYCESQQASGGKIWMVRSRSNYNLTYIINISTYYPLWANPFNKHNTQNNTGYYFVN